MDSNQPTQMIGAPVKRKEDPRLLIGDSMYIGDVDLKSMVHMAVLRSPHGQGMETTFG